MAQRKGRVRTFPKANSDLARLWAPWRAAYVAGAPARDKGCIFCFGRLGAAERRRRLVLYADPLVLVMLNRYPYNGGHLMVAPRRHLGSPELLGRAERLAMAELTGRCLVALRRALKPAGFNLGANLGRAAGAGITGHLHYHVVPRWQGDTNFMTALAATRLLSQDLRASFKSLAPLFKSAGATVS